MRRVVLVIAVVAVVERRVVGNVEETGKCWREELWRLCRGWCADPQGVHDYLSKLIIAFSVNQPFD